MIERIYCNDSNAARLIKTATVVAILASGCTVEASNNKRGQSTIPSVRITDTFRPTATPDKTYLLILTPSPTLEPTPTPTLVPTPTISPTPEPPAPTKRPTEKPVPIATPPPVETPVVSPSPIEDSTPSPVETPTQPIFSYDLYNSSDVLWQTQDACTAASAQMTLNMIASAGTGGGSFGWSRTTSSATEQAILAYERDHMVTLTSSPGSDPAGERNAINHYGFGDELVYVDESYSSFDAASKAVVTAIARTNKPAIVLSWHGGHAQIITGYKVTGEDPAVSDNFTIVSVNLTDPLRSDGWRDTSISLATWKNGSSLLRFNQDYQTDAVYTDPLDGIVGNAKWNGNWVAILPIG